MERLDALRPARILEAGSGQSTLFLALYARQHGAEVVSLEHDAKHHARSRALLRRFRLEEAVDLRYAPLRRVPCDGTTFPWYDTPLDGVFDFVLLDGPPERYGRQAALFALDGHLAPAWEVWLHDGYRLHEMDCLRRWEARFAFLARLCDADEKGLWILRDAGDGARPTAPTASLGHRLALPILTGQRPHLLRRTVEALERNAPDVLAQSYTVVFVNGTDRETRAYVDTLPFVNDRLYHDGVVLPIGEATSRLMQHVATQDAEYVLHLQDDWEAACSEAGWLARARAILDENLDVGQVRLRHSMERVLPYHQVTRSPIAWRPRAGFEVAAAAHFTLNPSLVRASLLPHVFPCDDERDAQRNFLRTGLATAQLLPGVFCHLGGDESLKWKMVRERTENAGRPRRRSAPTH